MARLAAAGRRHPAVAADEVGEVAQRMRIPIESSTTYRGRNSRPNVPALLLFVGIALGVGVFAAGVRGGGAVVRSAGKPAVAAAAKLVCAAVDGSLCADGNRGLARLARTLSSRAQHGDCRLRDPVAAQRGLVAVVLRTQEYWLGVV